MSPQEFSRLMSFWKAKQRAPRFNGTSKFQAKSAKKAKDLIRGRYISQRGFARI